MAIMTNLFSEKRAQIHNSAVLNKNVKELVVVCSPVNHGTRHRCSLALVSTRDQETQSGVVKKTNRRGATEHVFLPMSRVGCDRHEREHFRIILAMGRSTPVKPMLD